MERTYLQWNVVNFMTVLVMAAVGVAVFGAVASLVRQRVSGTAPTEE